MKSVVYIEWCRIQIKYYIKEKPIIKNSFKLGCFDNISNIRKIIYDNSLDNLKMVI